jgi:hypothetical protein
MGTLMNTVAMFLADIILGALLAGAIVPLLMANGMLQSQAAFWIAVAFCVALVSLLHGTFRQGTSGHD